MLGGKIPSVLGIPWGFTLLFNYHANVVEETYYSSHFTDEKTEANRYE